MKRYFILIVFLIISGNVFAEGNDDFEKFVRNQDEISTNILPVSYQQFKNTALNLKTRNSRVPIHNYRGKDNYLMLYVAGGVVAVTTTLVLINGNNGYDSGLGEANTGILIGGGVMTGLIVTKYFIDKSR